MNLDQNEIESVVLEPERVVVNVEQSQENSTVMIVQSKDGAECKNILENDTVAINQCAKDSSVILSRGNTNHLLNLQFSFTSAWYSGNEVYKPTTFYCLMLSPAIHFTNANAPSIRD